MGPDEQGCISKSAGGGVLKEPRRTNVGATIAFS